MYRRVDTLERRVQCLERIQNSLPARSNSTVNEKMHKECYHAAKRFHDCGEGRFSAYAEQVHEKTGMKFTTAKMAIMVAYALISGELYKSAISGKSADLFFKMIQKDYGSGGLQKAILAMRKHINYRRASNHNVDLLENLCDRYEAILQSNK